MLRVFFGAVIVVAIVGGLAIAFDHDVASKDQRVFNELHRRGMR
jgi:hypothetical protein